MTRFTLVSVAVTALLLAANGCGGGKAGPAPSVPLPGPGFDIAEPGALLRQVSLASTGLLKLGKDYQPAYPNNNAAVAGNNLQLTPDWVLPDKPAPAGLAYAMFLFDLDGFSGDNTLCFDWDSAPADPQAFYLGIGDATRDRWQWFGGNAQGEVAIADIAQYITPEGLLLVTTLLTGEAAAQLAWLRVGGNLAPSASFTASPQTGQPPLSVDFDASASSDAEGAVTLYDWDFNGGGVDESSASPTASFNYAASGIYPVTLTVTDEQGLTDTTELTVSVYDEEEQNDNLAQSQPLPAFDFDGFYGNAGAGGYDGDEEDWYSFSIPSPGTYTFICYFTTLDADLDMQLRRDDGGGDSTTLFGATSSDDNEVISYTFALAGTYYWRVYVYPSAPPGAVADYRLRAFSGAGEEPVAALSATPAQGAAPLDVTFDAAASSDGDGKIELYEYDFDGDGVYDHFANDDTPVLHTYANGGDYVARLRVTDDTGLADTVTKQVKVFGPPPQALFSANPKFGTRVLRVEFDASASHCEKYEWDFDGDGEVDKTYDEGLGKALATAYYYTPGVYAVKLTVTDNQLRTASAEKTITVTGGGDSESEPNDDGLAPNNPADAAAADVLPALPFTDYFAHVGPKDSDRDDWYKVVLSADGELHLSAHFFDSVCDIDIELFEEGDYATELAESAGAGDLEELFADLSAGTYYLRVYAFSDAPAAGGYYLEGEVN